MAVAACAADRQSHFVGPPDDTSATARCHAAFESIAAEVRIEATTDAEASKIPGYPFLRANRFLASFADANTDPDSFQAWLNRLRDLALEGIRVEVGNLPLAARKRLDERTADLTQRPAIKATVYCADILTDDLSHAPEASRKLVNAVDVPDHYDDLRRVVGIYPLTALPVALGYDQWRRANLGTFKLAPRALPATGERIAYAPSRGSGALPSAKVKALVDRARDNPLGIPEPAPDDAARLIDAFAPVWLVDTTGSDDRIGAMAWDQNDALTVVTSRPVTYHRLSWTRFGGDTLLQLNYLAWFPARPRQSAFDILGGPLDAVLWRVTLGTDGRPMIYDSIHACGCYHLFFPVQPLIAKPGPPPRDIRERTEIPAKGPDLAPGDRAAVWLAGVSHYIQAVSTAADPATEIAETVPYDLRPADQLRRLETAGGRSRSMYRPDGIVDGTERLERFLLWPMGIASAGAMRQWGTHATAFVGRRHFDDPWLFENAFTFPPGDGR